MVKDNRTVLCSGVGTLAVQCGRIMTFPEYTEEFFVAGFCRVKRNLCDLGMACISRADIFVGWMWLCAAGIPGDNGSYAIKPFKNGLHAPETTGTECCLFHMNGLSSLLGSIRDHDNNPKEHHQEVLLRI